MPTAHNLSDQELIDTSHRWRRLALAGDTDAIGKARRHEAELRRRLGALDPSVLLPKSGDDDTSAISDTGLSLAAADIANRFVIATADASTRSADALRDLLHNLRVLLAMDIAFVAEFVGDRKIYRHIDHEADDELPVKAGDAVSLETTLCQRVVDGRLPEHLANARAEPLLAELLTSAKALDIGAYLSTPVVLRDGSVYGTLCCISHTARSALGNRQVDALRYVAGIVAAELDRHRT
ncbi:MAG: GAF domain-containing protein [Hyphomicrobiaceae bacterium]